MQASFFPLHFFLGWHLTSQRFGEIRYSVGVCIGHCLSSGRLMCIKRGSGRQWSGDRSQKAFIRRLTIAKSKNGLDSPRAHLVSLPLQMLFPLPGTLPTPFCYLVLPYSRHPLAKNWLFTFSCRFPCLRTVCFSFNKTFISKQALWSFSWQVISQKQLLTLMAIWLVRKLGGFYRVTTEYCKLHQAVTPIIATFPFEVSFLA